MTVFPFGKHKNQEPEEADTAYLEWWLENVDAPPRNSERYQPFLDFNSLIEEELASRKKFGDKR